MRKVFAAISILSGILTFVAAAFVFKDGSDINAVVACIPAFICFATGSITDYMEDEDT